MNRSASKNPGVRRPLMWTTSLAAVMLAVVLGWHWQGAAQELRTAVQQSTEEANRTLTRVFVNENWERVRPLLPPPGSGAAAARANPRSAEIDEIVRRFSRTTDILKVKIYDLDGTTVYSSDAAQIGEDKSRNPGFLSAARGQVASELTHRGTFGGFDGELYQRDLVSSYVPVRVGDRVESVIEIYADRTASIAFLDAVGRQQVWTLLLPSAAAVLLMLGAGLGLQVLLDHRRPQQTGIAESGDAGPGSRPPLSWLPGTDDPIARAIEELNWEIASLKAGSNSDQAARPGADSLARVQARADEIQTWIRTVSDLTALLSSRGTDQAQAFSVDEMIDAVATLPTRQAAGRGVQMSVYRYPSSLGTAEGDAARIASLLGHLLGVSVAVTQAGRIELKALATPGGLRLDLIDTSTGWPQEHLDRLAEAWDTGSLPPPTEAGLEGMRLVLCRGLAQALGGHSEFRSTPGHGSRLSVQFPLAMRRPA